MSIGLILQGIGLLVVFGLWIWMLIKNKRRGGMFDWGRNRTAVLELPRDLDATRELVFDGLLEHLGTRSSKRRTAKRRFKVVSHLGDYGSGSQWYAFALDPLGAQRTRLTVTAQPVGGQQGPPAPELTDARIEQLDGFAAWLASHGEGRVLTTDWGKP